MDDDIPPTWKDAWAKRKPYASTGSILAGLLSLTGAKERFQRIRESQWLEFVGGVYRALHIEPQDSVFEVGCGPGGWLYPLYVAGNCVGGMDYSEFLIETARRCMPQADLFLGEAAECPELPQYDVVVSHSVFYYFPSYGYAEKVLVAMAKKAKKRIGILSVPDLKMRDEFEARRRSSHPEGEYDRLYKNLSYLYFDRDFFTALGDRLGLKTRFVTRSGKFKYHVIMEVPAAKRE